MSVRVAATALLSLFVLSGCPKGADPGSAGKPRVDAPSDADKSDEELYREAIGTTDLSVRASKLEYLLSRQEAPEKILQLKQQLVFVHAELGDVEKLEALAKELPLDDDLAGSEMKNAIAYTYAEKGIKLDLARSLVMQSLGALDRMESEGLLPPRQVEETRGYFLDTLGWIDHKAGKNREAAAVLEEAARRLDHATIHWHLGEACRALGEPGRAGRAYARAAVLEGKEADAAKAALQALGLEGEIDAAALLRAAQDERGRELEEARREKERALLRNRLEEDAPEFSMTDFAGARLDNAKLQRSVTVLDFWASWCAPCREELPIYQALYEKYKERANFLAVSVDRYREEAEAFIKDGQYGFPVAHDDARTEVAKKFEIEGIPTIIVIGPCGRINWVHKGFNRNIEAILTKQIETLLSEKSLSCDAKP